jgi:putative membrane-bound dehydrogenase-like protein
MLLRPFARLILAFCCSAIWSFAASVPAAENPADRPNLAGLATPTASSEQPGNPIAAALDGDEGTRWCAADGSAPQWWRADFEKPQRVVAVELDWESPGREYRYVIETSRDGTTWAKAADVEKGTKSPAVHDLATDVGTDVRAVRVTFLGGPGWASIREARLVAPPGTAVPKLQEVAREKLAAGLAREVKPPAGFTGTLFATPAEANYPVFVAATADGTLFVSSDGNGSLGRDPNRGRILRLRDTDGDGAADEVKEFVNDLDSPRGLVFVDGRLVVLHPPHVTAFRDADGDGTAEEQERLVSGIAFDYSKRPADHTSNGLALGIDGWIYAAIGDFGFMEAEGRDGRKLQLRGGGVVRFRPDGAGLDVFARGTRNNLEAAVGPLLDMIARDNTNDGGGWNVRLHAFTGLEDHGYPRRYMHFTDEVVAPLADYGGGSGTGACWIDEPWMPAALNDQPYTCDWGTGKIYRHPLVARGAGYEAKQEPFLEITRATDLDVDALGNIYAASWRGGGFNWSGRDVGFVTRFRPQEIQPIALPDVERATAAELVAVLAGPSQRLRLEAQRALLRRSLVAEAEPAVAALARDASAKPAARVAAIFTLALGRGEAAVPTLAAFAADATVAPWAIRALGDLAASGKAVPHEPLRAGLGSTDARARREAVVALVRTGDGTEAARLLAATVDSDPIVAHTAVEALVRLAGSREGDVIAACTAALDTASTPAALRKTACRVLGELHSEPAVAAVQARLEAADAARRADLVWAAARQWRRESAWKGDGWGTRPDTRGPYYALEEWSASPGLVTAITAAVKAAAPAELPGLARTLGLHRLPAAVIVPELVARGTGESAVPEAATIYCTLVGGTPPPEAAPLLAASKAAPSSAAPASVAPAVDPAKAAEIAADKGPKLADRKIEEILDLVNARRGDRGVGAQLFASKKCVSCHSTGPDSAGLGPSLANAAGIYNRRQLAESILLPHKSIAQGFATTALVLEDGKSLVGFVTSEAADLLVMRDAQGTEHRVAKPTIEERSKLPTSAMPEGLVADLSIAQFASLLDYIEGMKIK